MEFHLILDGTFAYHVSLTGYAFGTDAYKLIAPRCIGMKGAFATRSPSGPKSAQEKSSLSLILVLILVCRRDRPIASATDMNRLANRVSSIGSGPFSRSFEGDIVSTM